MKTTIKKKIALLKAIRSDAYRFYREIIQEIETQEHRLAAFELSKKHNRLRSAFVMWQSGKTFKEVGDAFGVGRSHARQMCLMAERLIKCGKLYE